MHVHVYVAAPLTGSTRRMVEWTPVKGAATNLLVLQPIAPPPDTTTLLAARYLLIKTLVARQLH